MMPDDDLTPAEPELTAALRARFGDARANVDWTALEARIVDGARFRLASHGWQAPASRWARTAIPAALAASVLLAVGLMLAPNAVDDSDLVIEEIMAVSASAALPTDPLAFTNEEAFLFTILDETERDP